MGFKEELKAFRKDKGWSVVETAKRLDVSRDAVHGWESGRREPQRRQRLALIKLDFICSSWVEGTADKIIEGAKE